MHGNQATQLGQGQRVLMSLQNPTSWVWLKQGLLCLMMTWVTVCPAKERTQPERPLWLKHGDWTEGTEKSPGRRLLHQYTWGKRGGPDQWQEVWKRGWSQETFKCLNKQIGCWRKERKSSFKLRWEWIWGKDTLQHCFSTCELSNFGFENKRVELWVISRNLQCVWSPNSTYTAHKQWLGRQLLLFDKHCWCDE